MHQQPAEFIHRFQEFESLSLRQFFGQRDDGRISTLQNQRGVVPDIRPILW
jgi:hypothetical protein